MKKITLLIIPLICISVMSQVGIETNTPHQSTILDMSQANNKGFLAPRLNLSGTTDVVTISSPAEGLIVYHTNTSNSTDMTEGYYYYDGATWKSLKKIVKDPVYQILTDNNINIAILGYYPEGIGSTAPQTVTVNGNTAEKVKCETFSTGAGANNRVYCSYDIVGGTSIDWETAYLMGKELGGFLIDIINNNEWNFVKTNFLDTSTPNSYNQNNIWIGFNKINYPVKMLVNPSDVGVGEYMWITGNATKVNFYSDISNTIDPLELNANKPFAMENNWAAINGLNVLGAVDFTFPSTASNAGSGYIQSTSTSSDRRWKVRDGADISLPSNHIIIEFLQ